MIRLIVAGLLLEAWAASAASPVFAQHVEAGAARAVEQPAPRAQPVYSVVLYDPARDPAVDLAQTIEQAEAGDKRILLEVGGAWCTWCHALERFIHEREAVARALRDDFIIMKVNYSIENKNEAFLVRYPEIPGFPHLFVLESDGSLLHAQGTADLEEGASYSEAAVLAFLKAWTPDRRGLLTAE